MATSKGASVKSWQFLTNYTFKPLQKKMKCMMEICLFHVLLKDGCSLLIAPQNYAAMFHLLSAAEASVDISVTCFMYIMTYSPSQFTFHPYIDFFQFKPSIKTFSSFKISGVSAHVFFILKLRICIKTDGWNRT